MMLRSSSFALTQFVDNHTDGSFVDHCRSAPSQLLTRIALAGLMASVSATAVHAAACGMAALGGGDGGPPSISATESSTTQVLEEIRRRTQVAQQEAQPIPVSNTAPAAAAESQASGGSSSAPPKTVVEGAAPPSAKKPKYKQVASVEQPAAEQAYAYPEVMGGTERIMASWGQGFLDYEHHDNIAPGQQENRGSTSKTAGVISGSDWTWINAGARQAVQLGYFSGYSATFNNFSNTNFTTSDGSNIDRTDSKQKIDGSFLGAYLAAIRGNATFDLAFKADLFDLRQSSNLTQTIAGSTTCPASNATETGSASVNNYTIAGDASYRYPVSATGWWEPIFSVRYTITDYGNDPTTIFPDQFHGGITNLTDGRLGLEDGTVLRLQGGIRRGEQGVLPDGGLWTVVGGAFLYSDVLITGFKFDPGAGNGTAVFPVDEGKIRGLGQILTTFDYANGWSYLMMGEVRGGEDLIGVGGRVGARYKW
jgi:hypothetical protein